jgi:chromosome segregation ATPase
MSFEIHKDAQVHGSAKQQLQLQIDHLKRTVKSPHDLVEHVIQLYGAEFEKANARIAAQEASLKASGELLQEQKRANDELFRIKQKVVIANRGLLAANKELSEQLAALPKITDTLREAHARVLNELGVTGDGESGFARDLAALCDFIEQYDNAAKPAAHMDAVAVEEHKRKAEDTPA